MDGRHDTKDAETILETRFARGEISRSEFEERKGALACVR